MGSSDVGETQSTGGGVEGLPHVVLRPSPSLHLCTNLPSGSCSIPFTLRSLAVLSGFKKMDLSSL